MVAKLDAEMHKAVELGRCAVEVLGMRLAAAIFRGRIDG